MHERNAVAKADIAYEKRRLFGLFLSQPEWVEVVAGSCHLDIAGEPGVIDEFDTDCRPVVGTGMNSAVAFRDDVGDPTLPAHQVMDTCSFIPRECVKTDLLWTDRPMDNDLRDRRLDERQTVIDRGGGGVGDLNPRGADDLRDPRDEIGSAGTSSDDDETPSHVPVTKLWWRWTGSRTKWPLSGIDEDAAGTDLRIGDDLADSRIISSSTGLSARYL